MSESIDLDAYFARIAYSGARNADLSTLDAAGVERVLIEQLGLPEPVVAAAGPRLRSLLV